MIADAFAAWLVAQVGDAVRKRATIWVLGPDQERALRQAAASAIQRTAESLSQQDGERAEQVAMVVGQVFSEPIPGAPLDANVTMLEAIQAGIAQQLSVLDNRELTETGQSSADLLEIPVTALAEMLTSQLLREIVVRGSQGGPLTPLASQLNDDVTHLQGQRVEGMLSRLADETMAAFARLGSRESVALPAAAHTLPSDVASFTGRLAELNRLKALLPRKSDPAGVVPINAIDGMAGIGKTAFAVHAAHQFASRFPDGQLFLRLHAHTPGHDAIDPADALAALLQGDGVAPEQIPTGLDARARLWRDRIAGRHLLLVLDDAASSEQVRPLLPGSGRTLVLVTSRHRLTALPEAPSISLDILGAAEAEELFIRLADQPGLLPGDDALAQLVALCGYLPLAISLMAGQLKHHPSWTAANLAAELDAAADRLGLMVAENISVAAAFDLSYRNLSTGEQRLFRRLGLHPGTDIDAYAAAALDETDLGTTRRLLDNLFRYHLIDEPAQRRYRFHDLIRQYASDLAATDQPAERAAAGDRLLDYYLHTARAADRHLARRTPVGVTDMTGVPPACAPDLPSRREAVAWMDVERLNLHAAVSYAALHDRVGHAIAMSAAVHGFLRSQGHWGQALTLHRVAAMAAHDTGDRLAEAGATIDLEVVRYLTSDYRAAVGLAEALQWTRDSGDLLGQANALAGLGVVRYLTGNYPEALTSLTGALQLHRDLGDRLGEAGTLAALAVVQRLTGDYDVAAAGLGRALQLTLDIGDRTGEANVLSELGNLQQTTGDYPAAADSLTEALKLCRQLGHRSGEANALLMLGVLQCVTGDYPAATADLGKALDLCRNLGNRAGQAYALTALGIVQRVTGDYPASTANLGRALELQRHLSNRLGEADALTELGAVEQVAGDYLASRVSLARALELHRDLGNRLGEAATLVWLGGLQRLTGDYPTATASLTQSLKLYRDLGAPDGEADALNSMGDLTLAQGAPADSRAHYGQALAVATRIRSPFEEARALEGIGRCQLGEGHMEQGAKALRSALAIYSRIGSPNAQRVERTLQEHCGCRKPTPPGDTHESHPRRGHAAEPGNGLGR